MSDSNNYNIDHDIGNFNKRIISFSKYYEYADNHGIFNSAPSITKSKIISQYTRSMNKNFDDFFHNIENFDFDVGVINETWLSNSVEQLY